jgi:LCP family protein required for cell wall assembly
MAGIRRKEQRVIREPAGSRSSLLSRIDRIVSSILALAFLVTGFLTGYRLAQGAGPVLRPIEWSLRGDDAVSTPEVVLETPVPARGPLPVWGGAEPFNLLIMGLDQRPGSALPGRADVIMIASVQPLDERVAVLSIPRDLWVEIPGHGENRINSAYFYGEFDGAPGGGPELMKRTIEENFDVTIDYYGTLDFSCFTRIIDILGGITLEVPQEIRDDLYPDDNYGYMRIYIPAGRQHMDGETALQYVRARHETSDFSRMRRQQQVLLAVRNKALRLDIVLSLPELIPVLGKAFSTDLDVQRLLALANLGTQIQSESIELYVVDESLTIPYVAPDGAQVLLPRMEQIRALLGQMLNGGSPMIETLSSGPSEVSVVVRADAGRPGLALTVADLLQRRGYNASVEENSVQIASEGTFIASRRDAAETALLIGGLLRVDPEFVVLDPSVEEGTDIVVTLGKAFVVPG